MSGKNGDGLEIGTDDGNAVGTEGRSPTEGLALGWMDGEE